MDGMVHQVKGHDDDLVPFLDQVGCAAIYRYDARAFLAFKDVGFEPSPVIGI